MNLLKSLKNQFNLSRKVKSHFQREVSLAWKCNRNIFGLFKGDKKQSQRDKLKQQRQRLQQLKQKSEDPKNWQDLGYLIKETKQNNQSLKPLLPPQDPKYSGKLTVVLEMDETLLYTFAPDQHEAYMSAPLKDYDFYLDFKEWDTFLSVYKRPHLKELLDYLKENCEAVLYTTGVKQYAEQIVPLIDPDQSFAHILSQEHCNHILNPDQDIDDYIQDLDRLNRDMRRVVYIDSRPFSFWPNPDNCIPIMEFMADSTIQDDSLKDLIQVLEEIQKQTDVRELLVDRYGIREALKESKMD